MAASDVGQTEAVQTAADEKWVFLQDDGEGLKELLLEEQDGDVKGENESLENAVEGQESALDVGKFLWWCRSACKDVLVRNTTCDDTTCDDKRPPYICSQHSRHWPNVRCYKLYSPFSGTSRWR